MGVLIVGHPAPSGAACTDPALLDCEETVFGAIPGNGASGSSLDFDLPAGIDIDGTVVFAKCLTQQTHAACAQPQTPCNIRITGYAYYDPGPYSIYEFGRATASSDCEPGRVDTIESYIHIAHACAPGYEQTSNANSGTSPTAVIASASQYATTTDWTRWCGKGTNVSIMFLGTFHLVKDKAPVMLCIQARAMIGGSWVFSQC